MLDLHTHIVPGIDDGSSSVKESLSMIEMLEKQGIDTIVSTSHYDFSVKIDDFIAKRDLELKPLEGHNILKGAEVYYYEGIFNNNELDKLCIENTNLLLLEMPFRHFSSRNISEIIALNTHFRIIMAHIDRYIDFDNMANFHDLKDNGVLFQVNNECFTGFFGKKRLKELLKLGFIDYFGSDCHDLKTRKPNFDRVKRLYESTIDATYLEYINRLVK